MISYTQNRVYSEHIPARDRVMLLSCMDLRLLDNIVAFMNYENLTNRYDQFILAGASLGIEIGKSCEETFFRHLELAIELHNVSDVYILEHRNCGAYGVKLGKKGHFGLSGKDQDREAKVHKQYTDELTRLIGKRIKKGKLPPLGVYSFLMDLRGNVELLADRVDLK
jgi:carbonic anhydrase